MENEKPKKEKVVYEVTQGSLIIGIGVVASTLFGIIVKNNETNTRQDKEIFELKTEKYNENLRAAEFRTDVKDFMNKQLQANEEIKNRIPK